jgi:hypothetical protein
MDRSLNAEWLPVGTILSFLQILGVEKAKWFPYNRLFCLINSTTGKRSEKSGG